VIAKGNPKIVFPASHLSAFPFQRRQLQEQLSLQVIWVPRPHLSDEFLNEFPFPLFDAGSGLPARLFGTHSDPLPRWGLRVGNECCVGDGGSVIAD